jgi:hypothetical protein
VIFRFYDFLNKTAPTLNVAVMFLIVFCNVSADSSLLLIISLMCFKVGNEKENKLIINWAVRYIAGDIIVTLSN